MGGKDAVAGYAFICYARDDTSAVDELQLSLEAAGIKVWRDTESLWPGQDWRREIRRAIEKDALVFLACFSARSVARSRGFQNEELLLAVDQLRRRSPGVPWLIPVRLDDCEILDFDLGAGRTLKSIQQADLFGPGKNKATARLIQAVQRLLDQR